MLFVLTIVNTVTLPGNFMQVQAEELPGLGDAARKAASEGIVLLENQDQVLPLKEGEEVSVFGRVQVDTFFCGYGSGGYVYPSQKVNILNGLRANPDVKVNEDLAHIYETWCKANPAKGNDAGWAKWPYYHPEMPLDDSKVAEASQRSQKAIVIIGRGAGEDRECKLEAGSYYLTNDEKKLLSQVNENFEQVIVLLNIGNLIDMSWKNDYQNVKAVLNIWQGGMQTGKAVADILSGEVNPSGKLASTIAKKYQDYPSSSNFGKSQYNNYAEDIFVGYRYFETFEDAKDKVMYPFGYGLSYTDFQIDTLGVTSDEDQVQVTVNVTNTGERSGKEVVQIYYGAPQGTLGKAAKSLAAYAKTPLLEPGTSQEMTLSFQISSMASYDDSGKTGHKSAFVLEAGEYPIYVGNSVRAARKEGTYIQQKLAVTEQLEEAAAPEQSFEIMTASEGSGGTIVRSTEPVSTRTVDLEKRIQDHLPDEIAYTGNKGHQLLDVYQGKVTMDEFIAQMSEDDLARIARGAGGMQSSLGSGGNAGVFGGVETSLRDLGIVLVSTHDGPSGLRLRDTDSSSLLPIGSLLACTWNNELVEYLYSLLGEEMIINGVDILLAPGMNLQRDPLCGRNFEYFSEDPLITGMMGAATTRGVQASGAGACLKHFAGNNQETNRKKTDSRLSERALREIYLRGFEIAVKTSDPFTVMSGYNKLNGVWCCYNYELMTTILRDQWGYNGMLMTDWSMQSAQSPFNENVKDNAYRVQAQLDLYMPGDFSNASIKNALGKGLTLGELQRSAKNILNCVLLTPKFARENALEYHQYAKPETYFQVTGGDKVDGESARLSSIEVGGRKLVIFNPLVQEYSVFHKPSDPIPEITVTAPEGVDVQISQATNERPVAEVKAEENGVANIYRITFEYGMDMTPVVEDPVYAYLDNIYLDGEAIPGFYSSIYEYEVVTGTRPEITVAEKEGVETTITYLDDNSGAKVLAESAHHAVTYSITFAQGPQSDEFDGDTLKEFWTNHAPTSKAYVSDGALHIETEDGDLYQNVKDLKNYISQPAQGDWESVTKIQLDNMPSQIYHQIGVKIMQDEDNYLYFRLEQLDKNAGIAVRLNEEKAAKSTEIVRNTTFAGSIKDNTYYMKVMKNGQTYNFYISADGENYVTIKEGYTVNYSQPKYTLVAANGTGKTDIPSIKTSYDYVRFTMKEEAAAKVVKVRKDEQSRIKVAEDFFNKSSELKAESCSDEDGGLSMGYSAPGEWALYTIDIEETGYYNIRPRISSARDELYQLSFGLELDAKPLTTFMQLGGTGGWSSWKTMDAKQVYLEKGEHKLKLYYLSDGININWLQFDYMKPHIISAQETEGAVVTVDKGQAVVGETISFTVTVNDSEKELGDINVIAGINIITVKKRADGSYYFEMPDKDVLILTSVREKTRSEEEYQALLAELKKKEEELYTKESELAGKEKELKAALEQAAELSQKIQDKKEEVEKLTASLTEANGKIEELKNSSQNQEEKIQELEEKAAKLGAQLNAAQDEVHGLEDELAETQNRVNTLKEENENLKNEVAEAIAQTEQIKKEAKTAKEELEQAKAEAEKAQKEAWEEAVKAKENADKANTELERLKASMTLKDGDLKNEEGVRYRVTNAALGQAEAYAPVSKKARTIKIAADIEVKGIKCRVTAVSDRAFSNMTKLTKVTIGKNVTSVGKKAFLGDKKLKKIYVKSKKLKKVEKQALKGISSKAVIEVPDSRKKAYKKIFKGRGQKKSVKIK